MLITRSMVVPRELALMGLEMWSAMAVSARFAGRGIGLGGWRELLDLHLVWRISKLMEFPASVAVWSNP